MAADSKIQTTIPLEMAEYIDEELKPMLGTSDSQVFRHIIYSWLADHGYLEKFAIKGDSK